MRLRKVPGQIRGCVDPEMVKYAWDELLAEAGVQLLHHVLVAGAIVGRGVVEGILVETKAGRRAVLAKRVIDCTGDGMVCHHAGVGWDQGDGEHRWAMACTKVFRMANVRRPRGFPNAKAMAKLSTELEAAIARGEFTTPVITTKDRILGYVRGRLWELPRHRRETMSVISRVLKVDPLDPFDLRRAEREGREQARQAADFYRRHVPGFEKAYLLDSSAHLGVRSSRRVHGLATVTARDAEAFRKYRDGIARGSWEIDVWPADSYTRPAVPRHTKKWRRRRERLEAGEYYDIRYGCLVAKGVDKLLMGGRCISAEHQAEASLRIQQTCIATGQAAGTAAALSLKAKTTPRELDPMAVVAQLAKDRAAVEPAFEMLRQVPIVPRPESHPRST